MVSHCTFTSSYLYVSQHEVSTKHFIISHSSQPCTNERQCCEPRIERVIGQLVSRSFPVRQRSYIGIQRVLQKNPVLLLFGHHCQDQQHKIAESNSAEYSDWRTLPNFSGCFHFCRNRAQVIPCLCDER